MHADHTVCQQRVPRGGALLRTDVYLRVHERRRDHDRMLVKKRPAEQILTRPSRAVMGNKCAFDESSTSRIRLRRFTKTICRSLSFSLSSSTPSCWTTARTATKGAMVARRWQTTRTRKHTSGKTSSRNVNARNHDRNIHTTTSS